MSEPVLCNCGDKGEDGACGLPARYRHKYVDGGPPDDFFCETHFLYFTDPEEGPEAFDVESFTDLETGEVPPPRTS